MPGSGDEDDFLGSSASAAVSDDEDAMTPLGPREAAAQLLENVARHRQATGNAAHANPTSSGSRCGERGQAEQRQCFLCAFAAEPRIMEYSNYIIKEIARSGVTEIAAQICADIYQEHKEAPPDIRPADVVEHIVTHMAHPTVKLAGMLRELDGVRRVLHHTVYADNPAGGPVVVDHTAAKLYLQVVAAQQNLYKLGDPSRLAFGQRGVADKSVVDA